MNEITNNNGAAQELEIKIIDEGGNEQHVVDEPLENISWADLTHEERMRFFWVKPDTYKKISIATPTE